MNVRTDRSSAVLESPGPATGVFAAVLDLTGPAAVGGEDYGLVEVEWCIRGVFGSSELVDVLVWSSDQGGVVGADNDPVTEVGCYAIPINEVGADYTIEWVADFITGIDQITVERISSRWLPVADLDS